MTMTTTNDENVIRGLVDAFVAGWNTHDGKACARPFAADADFTAITGLQARGRELIARGHGEILSTIYRGTQISGEVRSIRFLRPDVAVLDVAFTFQQESGQPFGLQQTSARMVVTKEGGEWVIAVFRNMVPFGRLQAGPLEQGLMAGTKKADLAVRRAS